MSQPVLAQDLMRRNFVSIAGDETLSAAMSRLLELRAHPSVPQALAVVDSARRFEGLFTARLLIKSLLSLWVPSRAMAADEERHEAELLALLEGRAKIPVRDALIEGLPVAALEDRLLTLIELGSDQRLEFIPVVGPERRLLGLVAVADVFTRAAGLALVQEQAENQFPGGWV